MQKRLNQKLSAVMRTENDTDGRRRSTTTNRSSSSKNTDQQRRRDQEQNQYDVLEEDEEEPVSPQPEYQPKQRSSSSNSQRQVEFRNNRLGAFLPGARTSSSDIRAKSKSKGYFGKEPLPQVESKGFAVEDDDDEEQEYQDQEDSAQQQNDHPENYDDDEDEDNAVEEDEEIEEVEPPPPTSLKNASPRRSRTSKLAPQPPLRKSSSKSKDSSKKSSKERLASRGKLTSNSGNKKQSKTKFASSSKESLGRKSSLKKVSIDMLEPPSDVNSVSSFIHPLGLAHNSYEVGSRGAFTSRSGSREVMALPIEIPDSVTDEDAFRHYLSVRRGANTDIRPRIDFEEDQSSYESVGGGGPSRLPAAMALNPKISYQMGAENHKRTSTLSYAIMTLALLSASASQLRFLVRYSKAHSYPVLNYFLVCLCIIIEIVVGVGYVILSRFNFKEGTVELVQSYLIAGLFFVAIANVIIAAFAFDDHVCEILMKQKLESQPQQQIQPDTFDTVEQ